MDDCAYQRIDEKKEKLPRFKRISIMETTIIQSDSGERS